MAEAIITVHVVDPLLTGSDLAKGLFERLKGMLKFGGWRCLLGTCAKFCGRTHRQEKDFSFKVTLDFYTNEIRVIEIDASRNLGEPTAEAENQFLTTLDGSSDGPPDKEGPTLRLGCLRVNKNCKSPMGTPCCVPTSLSDGFTSRSG